MESTLERVEREYIYIGDMQPGEDQEVYGYCEPMYGSDFEAKITYKNNEFYHKGKSVRCYYWKAT